ncbi:MAG TPA: hypothetical protein VK810_03885 [Dongiaceae bacterium]|jgi:hypothetical protein|nr:hypothetical protein [Dongiaceae bacterium]
MNGIHSKIFTGAARIFFALFAGIFLISKSHAQPAMQAIDNRFLLIFDTSAGMKKRLPAVQVALDTLLVGSMGGQMRPGDSIGVWTFGQDLHAGEFPLQSWSPQNGAVMASNIMAYVGKQHYTKTGNFDVLQASLNQVVENSDRLTVVIFCDGESEIGITPYDSGINRVFKQRQAEREKTRQPVAIVLRSQLGEFSGCTVSFPPSSVNLPDFPPLPQPPALPVVQLPPPVVRGPALIIVGTNVQTKLPPPRPQVQAIPPAVPLVKPIVRTNAIAAQAENSSSGGNGFLAVGAVFLGTAIALVVLLVVRSRKTDHASLITRSMNRK